MLVFVLPSKRPCCEQRRAELRGCDLRENPDNPEIKVSLFKYRTLPYLKATDTATDDDAMQQSLIFCT